MSDSLQPAAVIHIAGVEQANALLESLRRQGFLGDVTQADGHWQVVVHSPRRTLRDCSSTCTTRSTARFPTTPAGPRSRTSDNPKEACDMTRMRKLRRRIEVTSS